ncbi:tumor suppressor candidate 2 [Paramuricea clavata]|uniref:Tumor suppressor candidate 2 n=1 Tax=Paramuricea clavata TaxID=317549 RepID=A0A6S7JHQ0_PARCT|nr:tumor suppressor candidate 2 [Paramuricea clavata]
MFSSMFFNEDGDLAHEFYEEVKSKKKKRSKMKKVDSSLLRPQGQVNLQFPKIHPDLPIIMCEVFISNSVGEYEDKEVFLLDKKLGMTVGLMNYIY